MALFTEASLGLALRRHQMESSKETVLGSLHIYIFFSLMRSNLAAY
jgi:hypothetical protein